MYCAAVVLLWFFQPAGVAKFHFIRGKDTALCEMYCFVFLWLAIFSNCDIAVL